VQHHRVDPKCSLVNIVVISIIIALYTGKLPRHINEEQLIPLLSTVGTVYELRLMVDFTGNNRGYCFVVYSTVAEARRACHELNNCEIVPGKHIGVAPSVDNRRLFIGGIARDRLREHVQV
jgi:RNA recognition motif-containing protein